MCFLCSLAPQEAPVGHWGFDWLAAESTGRLYYYHLYLCWGAGGAMSRGSGRQPLLCVPDSQLEAAHCRRRVGCRVNCRGPNSWLYQGPLCLQQLSRQLRPGCNRWLISPVPDDTSISTRQVLFRTRSCLWLPPACPSFYCRLTEVGRGCHRPWSYLLRAKQ